MIPSGLCQHTLMILGPAFAKDQTVTHQFIKYSELDIHKTCFPQLALGTGSDLINHILYIL